MTTYYFDEDKAKAVCDRYLAECLPIHKGESQADVDGFWRVLRSAGGQEKLVVHERPPPPVPPVLRPGEGFTHQPRSKPNG